MGRTVLGVRDGGAGEEVFVGAEDFLGVEGEEEEEEDDDEGMTEEVMKATAGGAKGSFLFVRRRIRRMRRGWVF